MNRLKILAAVSLSVSLGVWSPCAAAPSLLPWQREISLREAAQSVALESTLNPSNPQPDIFGEPFGGPAMSINSLKMRTNRLPP